MDIHKTINSIGFALLLIFFGSTFIGKGPMNLTVFLLTIISFFYIIFLKKKFFINNSFLKIMLIPILVGFILSFFSELGFKGPFFFINRFKFILLLLPLTLFVDSKKKYIILFSGICISAIIAIFYGFMTPGSHSYGTFQGFHQIGRTADMMMLLSISLLSFIVAGTTKIDFKNKLIIKVLLSFLFLLYFWALLYSSIRGSWLGFLCGFFVLIIVKPKKTLPILMIGIVCFFLFSGKKIYKNDFLSIFDLNNNVSNNTRLHLWKTGFDFSENYFWFGTGAKNSEKLFLKFFDSQDKSYQEKYNLARQFPKDFHNSYLQILIETGIIFLLLFVFSHFYIVYKIIQYYVTTNHNDDYYLLLISISTSIAFFISQFFHGAFHSYGSSLYYFFLFGSFLITNDFFNRKTILSKIGVNIGEEK